MENIFSFTVLRHIGHRIRSSPQPCKENKVDAFKCNFQIRNPRMTEVLTQDDAVSNRQNPSILASNTELFSLFLAASFL